MFQSIEEKELTNIKTVCEYLFFDQFKDTASFQGFERAFSCLFPKTNIEFDKVFKEICGDKKKYITFRRFVRTYINYKKKEGISEDTIKFFDELFKNVLKDDGEILGKDIEKSLKFTTATYKNRESLSKILVLTNQKEKIRGINIQYEDVITCKMFPRKIADQLEVKLEMLFGLLNEEEMKKNKLANVLGLKEKAYRDSITHIFGTYTSKITFIGFKCRSGKTEFVGKPKGKGFLFGHFGKQFHYLKMQMTIKGIHKFEPHFIESKRKNVFLTGKLSEITNAFLKKEEIIKDEVQLQTLTDEIAIDKMITTPVMKESYFFNKKLKDRIPGKTFVEVCDYAPRKWLLDPNVNKKKENGEFYTLNDILNNYDEELRNSLKKPKLKRTKLIVDNDNNDDNELLNVKPKKLKGSKKNKKKTENWDGSSFKNLQIKKLIQSKENYRKLLDKVNSKIQNEIRKKDPEVYDLQKSLLDKIIYNPNENRKSDNGEIFRKSMIKQKKKAEEKLIEEEKKKQKSKRQSISQPHITSKLRGKRKQYQNIPKSNYDYSYHSNAMNFYNDAFRGYGNNYNVWDMFDDMYDYDDDFLDNFMIGGSRRNVSYDKYNFIDLYNKYEKMEKKENVDPEVIRKAQKNWKNLSELLTQNQGIYILQTIGSVIKAVHVLEKCETDEAFEATISLGEKIRLYKILTENENIINFLSSTPDENKKEEKVENDDILIPDEHPEEITDLTELTTKMESISNLLNQKNLPEDKKDKLQKLYDLYLQQKNILIENETKTAQKEIKEENKIDTNKIIKEEEEKRKKLEEEENKRVEEAAKKEIANETRKTVQIVSIRDKPSPENIFLNQPLYKGTTPFTDSYFPPEKKSLCEYDSNGDWILPPDGIPDDVDGWENIKFCRVDEVLDTDNYLVFHNGINPDDILQGSLGDCYFLSVIASLCRFPKLIENLFYIKEKSKEHCYGVYLFINGVWKLVLIDDYVPYCGRYFKQFAFSSSNGNELWVILLEKAWAKVNGSYARIGCGGMPHEVFDVVTESYSQKITITENNSESIWEQLLRGYERGYIMTAGTSGDTVNLDIEEVGLSPGHAYTILNILEIESKGKKVRLVHLRNPWGNGEYSGDWCDGDSKWTPALKKKYGLDFKDQDDGQFYMSYDDFIYYYCMIGIAKLHPDFCTTLCRVKKNKAGKPFIMKLTVPEDSVHAYINLYQKNPRIVLRDGNYQELVLSYLVLMDENHKFIISQCNNEMHLCLNIGLNKGTYYVISDINYRWVNNDSQVRGYNLTCYSAVEIRLEDVTKEVDVNSLLKDVILDYCQQKITPTKKNNVNTYLSKTYNNDFPFVICAVENNKKNPINFEMNIKKRGKKSFCFYCDPTASEDDTAVNRIIKPKETGLILIMQYSLSSLFTLNYNITDIENEENDEDKVFEEEGEAIDEDETLFQYIRECGEGYVVGLENKRKSRLKMKIVLEGLECKDSNKGKDEIVFYIPGKSKKTFNLVVKKNYYGDCTFQFDFA